MASYKVICKPYNDDYALRDVIDYITNPYKTLHCMIGAYGVQPNTAATQMEYVSRSFNKYKGRRLRHSIISFSENDYVTLDQAYQIADAAATFYANQFQIIFAFHENTDNLHVHFVMNQVSYIDGHKYHGSKKESFDFINYMKKICKRYRIEFVPVKY